jgi:exopolysaccharide biosynthesis polyprenyl glycosylphosphotransferase
MNSGGIQRERQHTTHEERAMQLREELVGIGGSTAPLSRAGTPWKHLSIGVLTVVVAVAVISSGFNPAAFAILAALTAAAVLATVRRIQGRQGLTIIVGDNDETSLVSSFFDTNRTDVARVPSMAEARMVLQNSAVREIVVAGDALHTTSLIDARGYSPIVISDKTKIETVLNRIPLEQANPMLLAARARNSSPLSNTAKRAFDLIVGIGIGIAVLPLIPIVILAIRLDSPGGVLYSQERVGLNGRRFRIFKFRSMRNDAERNGAQWAQKNDARVTRVGRIMRNTRIDELPQLWNVLRGDMTLVGPRPERPQFTEQLAEQLPGYNARHIVKPGLTGWAQVNYRYASSLHDTRIKTEYDLFYVKHSSLALDAKILAKTVAVVVGRKGQ